MTTIVEGGVGPVGHEPEVEFGFNTDESFQITPMTPDEVQDMYKRNLLVRQQLAEATFDGSLRAPIFGADGFRVNWSEGELNIYRRVQDALAAGEDPVAHIPVLDTSNLPAQVEVGETQVVRIPPPGSEDLDKAYGVRDGQGSRQGIRSTRRAVDLGRRRERVRG